MIRNMGNVSLLVHALYARFPYESSYDVVLYMLSDRLAAHPHRYSRQIQQKLRAPFVNRARRERVEGVDVFPETPPAP